MRRYLSIIVVSLLLASCGEDRADLVAVGTLERDRIEIVAEAWETLTAIEVSEGDHVIVNQVIARQDTARAEAKADQLAAALERSRQRLAELERGPREEAIDEARARLRGAEGRLAADERELERIAGIVARGLGSESDLDEARARRDVSEASFDEARWQLATLVDGATVEELEQARAAVAEAQAALEEQRLTLDRMVIRATRDGMIDAIPVEPGDRPRAGDIVAILLTDDAPYARVYVPAPLRARVRTGSDAEIMVESLDGVFHGRIRTIATEAAFTPYFALTERDRSRLTYLAEVTLTDPKARDLPTGFPVEVRFPGVLTQDGGG
ncbi:MAG: HlyD family secretion protein [Gammaproteobacteria bacterium]